MRILHEGNFNNPKVFEENNKYYSEYFSGNSGKTETKRIPTQCCRTCKYSSMYTNTQCPYSKFDNNGKIICRNNIEDDFEKFLESGQTEIEYTKESCWELYQGETIKGY